MKNSDKTERDVQLLFEQLKDALIDVKEGRVLTEEEFWAEYNKEDF